MSQRPNPLAIGLFFAMALTLLVVTLFFFGASGFFKKSERFVVFFDGSITGLKVGAPVTFQGVQVGQVADIRLGVRNHSNDILIPVFVDIDRQKFPEFANNTNGMRDRLIERGLRAQLKLQSLLTSLLSVELDYHPEYPVRLTGQQAGYPELPSIPTPMQELTKSLDEMNINQLVNRTRTAIEGIDRIVNSPDAQASLATLRKLLEHADQAVVHFDGETVPAVRDLRRTLENLNAVAEQVKTRYPKLDDELQATLKDSRQALQHFDQAMTSAQFTLSEDSPLYQQFLRATRDVSEAARSVESLSDSIEKQPESILQGKQKPSKGK